MTDYYILDRWGKPKLELDMISWAIWFEMASKDGSRRVAFTQIEENPDEALTEVITSFLGADHNFRTGWPKPPPILWETMVFGGVNDGWEDRYSSKDDAIRGHNLQVAAIKTMVEVLGVAFRAEREIDERADRARRAMHNLHLPAGEPDGPAAGQSEGDG